MAKSAGQLDREIAEALSYKPPPEKPRKPMRPQLSGDDWDMAMDAILAHNTTTGSTGAVAYPLSIPSDPTLVGLPIRSQWAAVDPSANALGLAFSPGGILTIGDF